MGIKKKQKNEESKEPVVKKIEDQSLDDFLNTWADSDGEDEETSEAKVSVPTKEEKKKNKKKKLKSGDKGQGLKADDSSDIKASVQSEEVKKKSKKKKNKSIEAEHESKDAKPTSEGKAEKKKKKKQKVDDNESKDGGATEVKQVNAEGKEKKKKLKKKKPKVEEQESTDDSDSDEETTSGARDQSKYLISLKDKDPEFYDFLKENDQELLDFNESSDGEDDDEDDGEAEDNIHKPPDKLEVASDESDADEDEKEEKPSTDSKSKKKLKQSHLDAWTSELEKQPNLGTISNIISAFKGAVATIGPDDEEQENMEYIVEGGILFNGIVRMCVVSLQPALKSVLKISPEEGHYKPEKAKNWKKVQRHVKLYLLELCKLLARIVEPAVVSVLLKHVHQMIPFFQAFQKGAKQVLQRLVAYWCQGEETVRILSFMCVVKLVRGTPLLETALKQMYMAYVRNCKFTSPSSLPLISFMRRSLVELMGLDHNLSYYHAFVYIRQLAIHLRNAITTNKKDAVQAVYNWQFIHSLELWGALLGHTSSSDALQPLIYPLVQVILGTARLIATPKYFPLRFHCCKVLTALSRSTGTFIPVLPFYLDVLNTFNFNKKSTKVSMKPIDFSCILKLSKSQLLETGSKDSTMAEIQAGLLAYLSDNSSKIGFPELVTPAVFQLKAFNKKCKVANYTKKIKQVLDKITANQKFIETRRKTVKFSVADKDDIAVWEASVERDGTPLLAFYKSWNKTREIQHLKKVSEQEKMAEDYSHIPNLKKNHKKIRMKKDTLGGDFLGSDDSGDDSFDEEEQFKLKEERGKGEKRKLEDNSDDDESDEDDDEDVEEKAAVNKPKQTNSKLVKTAEESDDDGNDSDVVEDLKLDDLDSDSEMDDEFDVSKTDAGNESSDSGSDDDSEDEN